ncbi:hypothetical protein, partial [Aureivirga sp. CE67]|uniref:hypothetical protein n=1 Tax=Aureivirga sp. CE67 TaxID=1788983 RepID=UPI0018C9E429
MKKVYSLLLIFLLFISVTVYSQEPTDAEHAITVCGDLDMSLNSNGTGINDFMNQPSSSPPCGFSESQSLWIRVVIETDGTLGFTLTSNNNADDYDFAVYGPNVTYDNLGPAIRCSATNPQAAGVPAVTGMNEFETETSEGPGAAGNGFVKWLDVVAGEEYYFLIDNWNQQDGAALEWTGTATFPDAPSFLNPNDISYDQLVCDEDGVNDEFTEFDLTIHESTFVGTQSNVDVTYHTTLEDAQIGINSILDPTTFQNTSNPQTIFVRLRNSLLECFTVDEFQIEVESEVDFSPNDYVLCADSVITTINFSEYENVLSTTYSFTEISFFETENNAILNNSPISSPYTNISSPQTIWVKVQLEGTSCYSIKPIELIVNQNPTIGNFSDLEICSEQGILEYTFDLTEQNDLINSGANITITYYDSLGGLISNPSGYITTSNEFITFNVLNTDTNCESTGGFNLIILDGPVVQTPIDLEICDVEQDSIHTWDLTQHEDILTSGGIYDIKYFASLTDVTSNIEILTTTSFNSGSTTIFYVLENPLSGCKVTSQFSLLLNEIPSLNLSYDYNECILISTNEAIFNLDQFVENLQLDSDYQVTGFYHDIDNSLPVGTFPLSNQIVNSSSFLSSQNIVYFSVENLQTGCWNVSSINLDLKLIPIFNDDISHFELCDNDYDGVTSFDLTTKEGEFLQADSSGLIPNFLYYTSEDDLESDTNAIIDPTDFSNTIQNVQLIWVKTYYEAEECYSKKSFYIIVHPKPEINEVNVLQMCNDGDGSVFFDLTNPQTTSEILNNQFDVSITYFTDLNEANQAVIDEANGNVGSFAYIATPANFENTVT